MNNINEESKQVYYTQGGGLVEWDNDNKRYIFIKSPDVVGFEVGDFMPEEWGII